MLISPAVATMVQAKLGCPVGIAFDVQAVCSGFVYSLNIVDGFVARGQAKCALVIGAETMTRLMDWTDRTTCVLFGDGVFRNHVDHGDVVDRLNSVAGADGFGEVVAGVEEHGRDAGGVAVDEVRQRGLSRVVNTLLPGISGVQAMKILRARLYERALALQPDCRLAEDGLIASHTRLARTADALRVIDGGGDPRVEVMVRRWSVDSDAFITEGVYELCLPRRTLVAASDNPIA